MPKVFRKPRRPAGVTATAWLRFTRSIQPRSKKRLVIAAPTAPAPSRRRGRAGRAARSR